MDNRPIGIMDSGLGGLTAVREVLSIMPEERIIYFGDTGRVPYGSRSRETIIKYARQDINFLKTFDVKLIIVACGTVSTMALEAVKNDYDIPVIGVTESAVERAAELTKTQKIAVIATQSSIASGRYDALLHERLPEVKVINAACPLLVPLVENGRFSKDDEVIKIVLGEYLQKIVDFAPDTMILGCTHYPLLREAIAEQVGGNVALVDPGRETARAVRDMLKQNGMRGSDGGTSFYVTDSVESFENLGGMFLSRPVAGQVFRVDDIEDY